jgi:hypothetical protein
MTREFRDKFALNMPRALSLLLVQLFGDETESEHHVNSPLPVGVHKRTCSRCGELAELTFYLLKQPGQL